MTKHALLHLTAARRYSATGNGRRIRQQAGLSLQDVADAIGTGIGTLSRWETGQRRPRNSSAALRWAELLADIEREVKAA